jgi:2-aminoadipate transaminase
MLSLALGMPAPELIPLRDLGDALDAILTTGPEALQYGVPQWQLKEQIVDLMRHRGVNCSPDEVFLTTGAQQGLYLAAKLLLLDRTPSVAVEELVYPPFLQAIVPHNPKLVSIPVDSVTGIDLDALRDAMLAGPRPAFLFTTSTGHNPLGLTMSAKTKAALVDLAAQFQVPIVEDDVYGFLQYDGTNAEPLRQLEPEWVFYVSSFSKIIAPGLRVGWMLVPPACMPALSSLKEGLDLDTATFSQRLVSQYLSSCRILDHIEHLCAEYRVRRDAMHASLLEHFSARAKWTRPSAGIFFWVEAESFGDTSSLLQAALSEGVAFVPGEAFCAARDARHRDAMRLNFSRWPRPTIEMAVSRIARAVASQARVAAV